MKNNELRYGLYGGLTVIIYLLGLYFVNIELVTNALATYWLPLLLIFPPFMYVSAAAKARQKEEHDFRELLRTPFSVFAIANVLYWLCLYGLHLADPEISRLELTQQLKYAQQQLQQGMGDPQQMNNIRQQVNDIQSELSHIQQPLGPYVFSMAIWMILGFGISAAITAIVRRK